MNIFINGIGSVLPDCGPDENGIYHAEKPKYREYIPPMVARRMGRETKMAVVAALRALKEANNPEVEAIITGTGLGAMSQTKQFMNSLLENNETMLNPASFIHSTPNTMSSAIAHSLQCNGYNATYSQRELSFEVALSDAILLLKSESYTTALVGGSDEYIQELEPLSKLINLPKHLSFGEGASYFVLSPHRTELSIELVDLATDFSNINAQQLLEKTIEKNNIDTDDISSIFVTHSDVDLSHFSHAEIVRMHPLVGFSLTASAHALHHAVAHLRKKDGTVAVVNKGLRGETAIMILTSL
ncbi:beta-ketoacyl synthase chain length factor [bacterium]|nr:beta-ketoacyl synthase chain length factor [bacterium]